MTISINKFGALTVAFSLLLGIGAVTSSAYAHNNSTNETVCTTIEGTLFLGLRSGEVKELQTFLRAEGYMKSQAHGFFNLQTFRAVRNFQADHDLRATGVVNAQTRAAIEQESCDDTGDELRIIAINAPTALSTGEEGTWTVDVESNGNSNLSYSVKWGDEGSARMALMSAEDNVQSSATFTHTYSVEGTYTPEFTVTDQNGNTVSKAAASVVVSDEADVSITSLSATSGHVGDSVTITGIGFASGTDVYVGNTLATEVTVASDTSITFTIPTMGVGSYDVYVSNENGTSNAIRFEVKAEAPVRISINGIDAPVRLNVNQEGTWTVKADTNVSGNLSYSVVWGDENQNAMRAAFDTNTQTSSTFTHSYSKAGTYKPMFTVSDNAGHSSKVSATVVVK